LTLAGRAGCVVFVEDAVPRAALGAGHPRSLAVLRELAATADEVVVVPTQPASPVDVAPDPLPANVVVADGAPLDALGALLAATPRRVRLLWVARPHNMAWVASLRARLPALFAGTRIVYDSEALFARREIVRQALFGTPVPQARAERMVRQELYPAEIADGAAAVSEEEREILRVRLSCPVELVGYPAAWNASPRPFAERSGALFVGRALAPDSPNGESLRFLLGDVWPRLGPGAPPLSVAGMGCEPDGWLAPFAGDGVRLVGPVADLAPLYDAARIFVAPTRFAAGIPIKVLDAARHGVPVVATTLLARQLGWKDGEALRVADVPDAFASAVARIHGDEAMWRALRDGARAALSRDFDPDEFGRRVRRLAAG